MNKIVKWMLAVIAALIVFVIVAYFMVISNSQNRIDQEWNVEVKQIEIPDDSISLVNGEHQAAIRGCMECHGSNFAGKVFIEDADLGAIYAPNITTGKGGINNYSDLDYIRSIRHGIDQEGKSLFVMPSDEYYYMDNADLGSLIAYLKSLPPVNNELPNHDIKFLAHALNAAGELKLLAAEQVDHEAPLIEVAPEKSTSVAYGKYLAITCQACHQESFQGGKIAGMPPDWPEASNLTPNGVLSGYSKEQFAQTMRTGIKPDGSKIDPTYMPWPAFGQMDDIELEALFNYANTL